MAPTADVSMMSGGAERSELLLPPGLDGAGPSEGEEAEPPDGQGLVLPAVTPPPGLGGFAGHAGDEEVAACEQSQADTLNAEKFLRADLDVPGQVFAPDVVMSHSLGGMKAMTSMPCGSWKHWFPPGFGDAQQWCDWDEGEPAVVPLGRAGGTLRAEDPAYVRSQEPELALEPQALLASEHARLAMENELLRQEQLQLAWGLEAPLAYWADPGYGPACLGACPLGTPQLLRPWGVAAGLSRAEGWGWEPRAGGGARPGATRARTDSDLPQAGPAAAVAPRGRTLSADDAEATSGHEAPEGPRTTVMLRNLPNNYTRVMLLALLDAEGFAGQYDFVYLPMDFKTHASLGYAFVNLASPSQAASFWATFEGFSQWVVSSQKVCSVSWSCPYQGLAAHIERYRNSPVMHEDVPDEYKPMVFREGRRGAFPPPTKKLKAPRMRLCRDEGAPPAAAQEGA